MGSQVATSYKGGLSPPTKAIEAFLSSQTYLDTLESQFPAAALCYFGLIGWPQSSCLDAECRAKGSIRQSTIVGSVVAPPTRVFSGAGSKFGPAMCSNYKIYP